MRGVLAKHTDVTYPLLMTGEGPAPSAEPTSGRASSIGALVPWGLGILVLGYLAHRDLGLFRLRALTGVFLLVLVVGMWRSRRALADRPMRWLVPVMLATSVLVATGPVWLDTGSASTFALLRTLLPVWLGWSLVFWLPIASRAGLADDRDSPQLLRPRTALLGFVLAMVGLTAFHWLFRGSDVAIIDEALYILQSQQFDQPGYSQPIPTELAPFFAVKYTLQTDGHLITQYPPGWPALLGLFSAVGLRWWINIGFAAAAVLLTFAVGRKLHDETTGLIAATLMTIHAGFISQTGSYFPHVSGMTMLLGAAWLLIAEASSPRRQIIQRLGAGALVGAAAAIRPLTGLTVGLSLFLWSCLRTRARPPEALRLGAVLALGALPFAAGILYYNGVTTGEPLTFAYEAVNGELGSLGFGERGEIRYDQNGEPYAFSSLFTVRRAAQDLMTRLSQVSFDTPAIFLLLPLVTLAAYFRFPFRVGVIAAFLILPAAHFFYYWPSMRFYSELLPFLWIGVGAMIAHIWNRHRLVGRRLFTFTVVASALIFAFFLRGGAVAYREDARRYHEIVTDLQREHGRVLLFVQQPQERPEFFSKLYWFNARDFFGNVIVARDLGPRNRELHARYPDHTPFVLAGSGTPPHDDIVRPLTFD